MSGVCVPTFSVPRTFLMAFEYDCILYIAVYSIMFKYYYHLRDYNISLGKIHAQGDLESRHNI